MADEEIIKRVFANKVYFIGGRDFGTWKNSKIKDTTNSFIEIYIDKFGEESFQELKAEFKMMNKEGLQKEYEIKVHFITDKGTNHTKKTGWDAYTVYKDAIEAIENQVFKSMGDYK